VKAIHGTGATDFETPSAIFISTFDTPLPSTHVDESSGVLALEKANKQALRRQIDVLVHAGEPAATSRQFLAHAEL